MYWLLLLISRASSSSSYSSDSINWENIEGPLGAFMAIGIIWMIVVFAIFLGIIILQIAMLWRIIGKAGYPGPLSLLVLIPGFGPLAIFIVFLVLAFSKWPIEKELEDYKGRVSGNQKSYSQPQQPYVNPQFSSTNPPPPPPK